MKRLLCATLTALVMAMPLYAQNTPSSPTPSSGDSTMGSDPAMKSGSDSMDSASPGSSAPAGDQQMQEDKSGSKKIHSKTKEVEMQEETTPSQSPGSTTLPSDSAIPTEEDVSEE